jgi:hypothetical protein
MSKKILLSPVILILSFQLQAQFFFGARAGNNFARLSNNESGNIFELAQFPIKTFHIGGIVQYGFSGLSDKFRLESGLLLSCKGGNSEYSVNQKTSLNYLELPVNAIFSLGMGANEFQIVTGPYMGFLVEGKTKIHYLQSGLDGKKPKDYIDKSIPAKTMDLGINMGVGMEMDAILIRIQYGYGLTNITKGGFNSNDIKNRVISFSIGCLFGDGY